MSTTRAAHLLGLLFSPLTNLIHKRTLVLSNECLSSCQANITYPPIQHNYKSNTHKNLFSKRVRALSASASYINWVAGNLWRCFWIISREEITATFSRAHFKPSIFHTMPSLCLSSSLGDATIVLTLTVKTEPNTYARSKLTAAFKTAHYVTLHEDQTGFTAIDALKFQSKSCATQKLGQDV